LTVHSGQRATLRVDAISLETGRRATIVQGNGAHLLPSGHITSLPDFRRDVLVGWTIISVQCKLRHQFVKARPLNAEQHGPPSRASRTGRRDLLV
jgi:hypothetical protein